MVATMRSWEMFDMWN